MHVSLATMVKTKQLDSFNMAVALQPDQLFYLWIFILIIYEVSTSD